MVQAHENRLKKEKKKIRKTAFTLNFLFTYYFFFAAVYLFYYVKEEVIESGGILLIIAGATLIVTVLSARSKDSLGYLLAVRTNKFFKDSEKGVPKNWMRTCSKWFGVSLIVLTLIMGWIITEMNMTALFSRNGMIGAKRIFVALFHPETKILGMVLQAMVETIFIALMATAIALPVAFVVSFMCARNLMKHSKWTLAVYNNIRIIFNFTRSVEPLIWAIIFSVWVGIGPFAGMLALMIHSVAALAKLYSEQIESIDHGPIEAVEATGANKIQTIWYAVVPQIMLPYLAFTIYRWDINVRMATIIGLVGGGGVGTLLMQYQGLAKWNHVGTIVLTIAIVVWAMDYISAKLREAIY